MDFGHPSPGFSFLIYRTPNRHPQTPGRLFPYQKQALWIYTKPPFWPVEVLGFSELKTPQSILLPSDCCRESSVFKPVSCQWRVPLMAGPGRFPSESRANSERTPSSEHIPSKFRANSGQIPSKQQASQTLYFIVILCNESPWLADKRELGVKPTMRRT